MFYTKDKRVLFQTMISYDPGSFASRVAVGRDPGDYGIWFDVSGQRRADLCHDSGGRWTCADQLPGWEAVGVGLAIGDVFADKTYNGTDWVVVDPQDRLVVLIADVRPCVAKVSEDGTLRTRARTEVHGLEDLDFTFPIRKVEK